MLFLEGIRKGGSSRIWWDVKEKGEISSKSTQIKNSFCFKHSPQIRIHHD